MRVSCSLSLLPLSLHISPSSAFDSTGVAPLIRPGPSTRTCKRRAAHQRATDRRAPPPRRRRRRRRTRPLPIAAAAAAASDEEAPASSDIGTNGVPTSGAGRGVGDFILATAAATATDPDPALVPVLLAAVRDVRGFDLRDVAAASAGLAVWDAALRKGRLPTAADFAAAGGYGWGERVYDVAAADDAAANTELKGDDPTVVVGGGRTVVLWPAEPLYSRFGSVLADLQLPRFVLRHPETAGSVLLGMLRLTIDFVERSSSREVDREEEEDPSEDDDEEDDDRLEDDAAEHMQEDPWEVPEDECEGGLPSAEEIEAIADELAADMASQWGGVIGGVRSLDRLFGAQHGLLDVARRDDDIATDDVAGFGLHDGVWRHSGWRTVTELQRRLSAMPELRDLIATLGRRPSARGTEINKFAPQVRSPDSSLGVQLDPIERTSVNGLTLSGSLSEMLPSEAVLLRGSSPALRRLFLARKVESKLLSYELSGYADVPAKPRSRPRYFPRLPSAPGGPIVVCLDTSWSMTGNREMLAKSVVLECVRAAHGQGRDCHVVAFSSERNTLECDLLAADAGGIRRLLDFLSHSFEGGTDVTGALKHAMDVLGTENMASADVLLVTDGELPNPPVPDAVLEALDRLRERTGMQVHGLLVGKKESAPLETLCTKVHDFLLPYDALASLTASQAR